LSCRWAPLKRAWPHPPDTHPADICRHLLGPLAAFSSSLKFLVPCEEALQALSSFRGQVRVSKLWVRHALPSAWRRAWSWLELWAGWPTLALSRCGMPAPCPGSPCAGTDPREEQPPPAPVCSPEAALEQQQRGLALSRRAPERCRAAAVAGRLRGLPVLDLQWRRSRRCSRCWEPSGQWAPATAAAPRASPWSCRWISVPPAG